MSRFFQNDSDSDTSSSSSSSGSSTDSSLLSEDERPTKITPTASKAHTRRVLLSDSEDESSGPKRVVRSARDKRTEELRSTVRLIDNAKKINDWVSLTTHFDKLTKSIQKAGKDLLINGSLPTFILRCLVQLEDYLKSSMDREKTAKRKMNASNAKAMNIMKQRLRKYTKTVESQLSAYREKPAPTTREVPTSTEQAPSTLTAVTDVQDGFTEVGKGGKAMTYKPELILKYLREVHEARGKKNTDKASQVKILQELRAIAVAPYHRIVTLLSLISAQFDLYAPSFSSGYMSIDVWKQTQEEVLELLRVLEKYADTMVVRPDADEEPLTPEEESGKVEVIRPQIRGSVASFIYRLDDEFTRSLQQIDPHSVEYIDRLRDERSLYATLVKAQAYFHRCGLKDSEASTVLRRLEHIYFKPDAVIIALGKELEEESETQPDALIHNLATQLYQSDAPVIRARAILCHIYHHALQDRYHVARDMLLMSHLQDSIHQAEPLIQIHYNRALVQLGLCAFRAGMIREAHGALHELVQTGRVRELLAQGPPQPRYNAPPISPEQERAERALLLPFHMHIHLELLEAVYLVSSMLLEVPNMASVRAAQASGTWTLEMRKRVISKTFRRMLDYHERQAFTGPPENTRDHIMAASKALSHGDWLRSVELLEDIRVWDLLPGGGNGIKEMLKKCVQEEGLRTYIFTNAPHYTSLSLAQLAGMFGFETETQVTQIVARMIYSEEVRASVDAAKGLLLLGAEIHVSPLQVSALAYAERVGTLVDSNERILDARIGGDGGRGGDRKDGGQHHRSGQQRSGRSGRGRGRGGKQGGGSRQRSIRT
ncbi:MAG: eukaryotic translation initiation factor 3 subunit 8 N-terminus-domain-containing protein [Piptocephalis tieghemiana]|nr:MAG: eukaryotic translation initiation factor 3 subunit 8 N-terminus-domain-containing protein [Piptocephalis tieghemiana]